MTDDARARWDALSAQLDVLLDLDETARRQRLEQIQTADPDTAAALRDWLRAIDASGGLLEAVPPPAGTGPWRPLALVGEGGMGEVWRGERADGAFERAVAIKLLRTGRGASEASIGRERAMLARLRHPGIAQLLDGGVTGEGRPWLVTEWVDGQRLDEWLRQSQPSLRQRVALLRGLGDAVAYAHANLVVHRDLKPANVMVDVHGAPRLLDFGIARLLDNPAAIANTVDRAMTPAWAAPEQLRGEPLDARTDVYALGGVLFYALTGRTPHGADADSLAAVVEAICHTDPEPPGTFAPRAGIDADLDAITLKALARDPAARYASADAFAADLGRWLDGHDVDARLPTRLERVGRLLRRRPVESALAGGLVLVLVSGIGATLWQAREAEAARQAAVIERDAALAEVDRSEYLVDIFARLFREGETEARLTASEWLDRAAALGGDVGPENAVAHARFLLWLAAVEQDRGQHPRSVALLRRVLAAAEPHLPLPDRARAECRLAAALAMTGDASADAVRETGIQHAATLRGADRMVLVDCLAGRANAALSEGAATPEAFAAARRALQELDALSGASDLRWRRGGVLYALAALHDIAGEDAEAARNYDAVAAIDRDLGNTASSDHAALLTAMAGSLQRAGNWAEADRRYAQGIAIYEAAGAAQPNLVSDLANYAALQNLRADPVAALANADRALALAGRAGGGHPVAIANAYFARGVALRELGRHDEAAAALDTAASRYRESHADPARPMRVAAAAALNELARGRLDAARKGIDAVVAFARESRSDALLAEALQVRARVARAQGDATARGDAEEAVALLRRRLAPGHPLWAAAEGLAEELQ